MLHENILIALALIGFLGLGDDAKNTSTQTTQAFAAVQALTQAVSTDAAQAPNGGADEPFQKEQSGAFAVPFFSQFDDITSPTWQKVGCGITSLAMIIDFYDPGTAHVDTLLQEGVSSGAYLANAGWTYKGLIGVAERYGILGASFDMGGSSMEAAYETFKQAVGRGPVMASVHYTFEPTNPIPHLVVIRGIVGERVYYNDPADHTKGGYISAAKFKAAWKKRWLEFWPIS